MWYVGGSTKTFNDYCVHPGKRLPNNARVYLPGTKYDERTHIQFLEFGKRQKIPMLMFGGGGGRTSSREHRKC